MKGKFILIGVAAMMAVVSGVAIGNSLSASKEARDAKIIVQVNKSLANKAEKTIINEQNVVINRIRQEVTNNFDVEDRYVKVVNGFVMNVNAKYVSKIREIVGVQDVNYNATHFVQTTEADLAKREAIVLEAPTVNISKDTMNVPNNTKEGEGTLIAILDTGFMINASYKDDKEVQHENVYHAAFTALDESVQIKYTQEQIKAKVDAAGNKFHGKYDATHSTYFNSKVPFYYDYGGDIYQTGDERPDRVVNPDYDVFDQYNDHGNHVASIAAGNDPQYYGIAPKAQLALMKVFTPIINVTADGVTSSTGATDVAILSAFEDCISLGVDVINMSLGSTLNDFTESSIVLNAVKNLKNNGILCAIAAGNDGKDMFYNSAYEYWTTDMVEHGILGGYAGSDATVVGSIQPDRKYYDTALKVGSKIVAFKDQIYTRGTIEYKEEHYFVDLLALPGHENGDFEWVRIPGWGEAKDYAALVSSSENKVQGKIAIISRGETTFAEKISIAQSNGAIGVGIIDNDPSATDFNFNMDLGGYEPSIPVISILFRDKEVFDSTDYSCKLFKEVIESNPTAREIADSSSDGPVYDLSIKPEIVTPGDSILGAVYAEGPHSYEYYGGTSMATPNYAGVYALMLSEHLDDANWKATLTDRLMSTAKPIKDKFGTNFEAVRKQGSGLVDVEAALNTNLVLDGSNDKDHLLNKAKIELKNNDDIKAGKVNLNFVTINSAEAAVEYDATLYVYRPKLGHLNEKNFDEKLAGAELMSNNLELIEKVSKKLTVNPGANAANFSYDLSADAKAFLDEKFAYGTYLEGFLILNAEGKEEVSLPFLGFYGDYSAGIPVEPFKFERDNDKVYPSDLLNSVGNKWAGLNGIDYGSDWVIGNWTSMSAIGLDDYILNQKTLRDLFDSNSKTVFPAGTNPFTGEYETKDIYMGNNGFANTMIIQQFVMRSVENNTITITRKSDNKVFLVDHMFDSFYGAVEDENGKDIQWPLYKSFVDTTYWSAGYLAHRAYTIIPLYEYEYDEKNEKYIIGDEYPEGEYEMKFSYDLAAGGKYEKTYTLHIDNSAPKVKSVEDLTKDGKDYLRIRYEEIKMSYVAINGYKFPVENDDKGYYIDVEKDKYTAKNKIFVRGYDFTSSYSNMLTHVNDERNVTVSSASLTNAFDFDDGLQVIDDKSFSLQFSFTKSNKATTLKEDMNVSINMSTFENIDLSKGVNVAVEKDGKQTAIASSLDAVTGTLSFTINSQDKVVISYSVNEVVPPDPSSSSSSEPSSSTLPSSSEPSSSLAPSSEPSSSATPASSEASGSSSSEAQPSSGSGCGGSILGATSLIALVAVAGIGVLFSKKKKD